MSDGKEIIGTVGLRLVGLAITLLTIALIVWIASKAWKKGQAESNYANSQLNTQTWLGY